MNDVVKELLEHRGKLLDRKGGWIIKEGVFSHGKDLLREMLPNYSYTHVIVLNALGFVPEDRLCRWLEAIFICLSWPDPRIWCNGIGALAGSANSSTLAGTAAGMLASDSVMYGPYTLKKGVSFFQRAKKIVDSGVEKEDFIEAEIKSTGGKVHLMGYARPIATGDERLEAMLAYAEKLGFSVGPHVQLALDMESYLSEKYNESLNIGGYISAFLSDQGLTAEQVYDLFPSMVNSGVTACLVEQREKVPDSYLPLTCEDIEYNGPERRSLSSID